MNHGYCMSLREKYSTFYYRSCKVEEDDNQYTIKLHFSIEGLKDFFPTITIEKKCLINDNLDYINYMAFQIGLVELISYWKCTCSPNVVIEAGSINEEQKKWFLKLYYLGLGEFFYINGINLSIEEFMSITCTGMTLLPELSYQGSGNLVTVGGGKDSAVALELLTGEDNTCIMINPKEPGINCMKVAGYDEYIKVIRKIDAGLLELNKEGYLNGHTPFSAIVAFVTYLAAYLSNKSYIVLSNEGSANEATVIGTNVNHQYSKTYEFESDFNLYSQKYLGGHIKYFSLLRCLNELQIGLLFANYTKYHDIFKSCNVGSKSTPWNWCGKCPKCLFVYIILSPFINRDDLNNIFGTDLYEDAELLPTFLELLGYAPTKPFECVGTFSEVRYAVSLVVNSGEDLPYLLKYYKDNFPNHLEHDYRKDFNHDHNIEPIFLEKIKGAMSRYV